MRFASYISLNNIKRKPLRALGTIALAMCLSFTLLIGALTINSLSRGLDSYASRLGADLIVIPGQATSHGSVDDILLQGITGNYYMTGKECQKVSQISGIEQISRQFYLTSAKASCCSSRVQIIGFDPKTDFSIRPWINENYNGDFQDGDIIVGSRINVPSSRMIRFYGTDYHVVAQLAETGTGLDRAVYTNMATIQKMAHNAVTVLHTDAFEDVNIETAASALMIKVKKGYDIENVTNDINIHITKVKANSSKTMIAHIMSGLTHVSRIIGVLIAVIWVLALIVLSLFFILLSNERKKEFAIMRIMGATRSILTRIMFYEAVILSLIGTCVGLMIGLIVMMPIMQMLSASLSLPMLTPDIVTIALICAGTIVVSLVATVMPSLVSARMMTKSETGLLLREDG